MIWEALCSFQSVYLLYILLTTSHMLMASLRFMPGPNINAVQRSVSASSRGCNREQNRAVRGGGPPFYHFLPGGRGRGFLGNWIATGSVLKFSSGQTTGEGEWEGIKWSSMGWSWSQMEMDTDNIPIKGQVKGHRHLASMLSEASAPGQRFLSVYNFRGWLARRGRGVPIKWVNIYKAIENCLACSKCSNM